jgi:ABC-type multidrug transport system fused ATPase/permease subunit
LKSLNPFRRFAGILKIYQHNIGSRWYILVLLSILVAMAEGLGISMFLPLLMNLGINKIPEGEAELIFYNALKYFSIENSLFGILFIICILFITKGILTFIHGGYTGYLLSDLAKKLKEQLFVAYCEADYCHFIKNNSGHYMNVFSQQANHFALSFNRFSNFISFSVMAIFYVSLSFLMAWKFALMAIIVGVVFLMLFRFLNELMRKLSLKSTSEESHVNKLLIQALHGFKYIASTNQSNHLKEGVFQSTRRLKNYGFQSWLGVATTQGVREPILILTIIALIMIQVVFFKGSVSTIFVVILIFYRTINSCISIQTSWQGLMSMMGSVEMVNNELKTMKQNQELSGSLSIQELRESIELKNISFSYDEKQGPVLKGVNISIPANNTIAFVGESGAGKSTLVDLLTLLLKPQSGNIYIDGVNTKDVENISWRDQIGYVSQEAVIFDDTIANNICMWQGDTTSDPDLMRDIKTVASQSNIDIFVDSLLEGFQTIVGEKGVLLSGGQKQRLFIARELFKKPNLLILDEATSSLDSETEVNIQKSLDALRGRMTVVIVAHRLSTIRNADKIYVLDQGNVIESGTYNELILNSKSKLTKMIKIQAL